MTSVAPDPSTITATPTATSDSPSATCNTAVPDRYGHVPIDACNAYYSFYPSFAGNAVFAVLFGLTMLAHLGEAIHFKKRFCWVIIMGALWECLAFILRTIGAHDQQSLGFVIGATLLLLLAPLWINAFAYMTVARLVYFLLPEQRVWGIKATWLTKIFVGLDIVSFLVQAAGGSLMSNQDADSADIIRTGKDVYMAGIGLQGAFILLFSVMTWQFYRRMLAITKEAGDYAPSAGGRVTWRAKALVLAVYAVLFLILVRIVFRLVEFSGGVSNSNALLLSEAYVLSLDALPMFLALTLMNCMHPGLVLRGPQSEFAKLTRKERKELKRQKKERKEQKRAERKSGAAASEGKNRTFVNEAVPGHSGGHEMMDHTSRESVA